MEQAAGVKRASSENDSKVLSRCSGDTDESNATEQRVVPTTHGELLADASPCWVGLLKRAVSERPCVAGTGKLQQRSVRYREPRSSSSSITFALSIETTMVPFLAS
ncbi:hypothetical protein PCL_09595 [Purpureocillium lilacinum]|uniref:Uncharacterized protein n=1 Tax=Purpureocillium lilacinum TaxID=33203 RepID=A0A2U3DQJ8_PURLI|nr:hypothetical protein PCL_09595 [Purpureocillium lilacinum]